MENLRDQNRMATPGTQWLTISISLGLHLLVVGALASRVLFSEVHVSPALAVFPVLPKPWELAARSDGAGSGAAMPALGPAASMPALQSAPLEAPPPVALPPPDLPSMDAPTRLLPGMSAADPALQAALAAVSALDPARSARAAFEGDVYLFRRAARLRTARGYFQGSGRQEAPEKLYTHALWVPGRAEDRVPNPLLEQTPWLGVDYRITLQWPESLSGICAFRMTSDAEAVLQIDGEDVIQHDGKRGFRPRETVIELAPGPREFRLACLQGPRSELGLILHYRTERSGGWRLFDLRDILRENFRALPNPLQDELDTAQIP